MLSIKQGDIKYHFLSLWYDNLGLNSSLPDHWWTLYLLDQWPSPRKKGEPYSAKLVVFPPSVNAMWTNFNVRKYIFTNSSHFRLGTPLHWTWWCPHTISNILATMIITISYKKKLLNLQIMSYLFVNQFNFLFLFGKFIDCLVVKSISTKLYLHHL